MTGLLYNEFLYCFDNQIHRKNILLLIDNFSVHELGIKLVSRLQGLQNTRVA